MPPEQALKAVPFDLHVLGLPLAFILSQDQTLHCIMSSLILTSVNILFFVFRLSRRTWRAICYLLKELFRLASLPGSIFMPPEELFLFSFRMLNASVPFGSAKVRIFSASANTFLKFFFLKAFPADSPLCPSFQIPFNPLPAFKIIPPSSRLGVQMYALFSNPQIFLTVFLPKTRNMLEIKDIIFASG